MYGCFVCGIELPDVDFGGGVEGVELALVCLEVVVGEVADVDCAGAVARELMCACAADAYL